MLKKEWERAEALWEQTARKAAITHPLKGLDHLPKMPGITPKTAKRLKWKALKYLILHDSHHLFTRHFFKHPLKYGFSLLRSYFRKAYRRDGDFFLYGFTSTEEFQTALAHDSALLVIGFSYCHKPFECPSGRFTSECMRDKSHPVCQQCYIGKVLHSLPEKEIIPLIIPTIHYIGEKIFEIVETHPSKKVLFLITACEMTLEMFGDWGNMVNVKGIGVRLDGRICNTMPAFELSERGIKPGLTVVTEETKKRLLALLLCTTS